MTTPREPSSGQLSTADMARAADQQTDKAPTERTANRPAGSGQVTEREAVERGAQDRAAPQREHAPLFASTQAEDFRGRWSDIQASFVDEPRRAVEQADGLVAEVMQRLAQVFSDERKKLEQQWDSGGDTDTEELRQALRRYRSFFDRLLAM